MLFQRWSRLPDLEQARCALAAGELATEVWEAVVDPLGHAYTIPELLPEIQALGRGDCRRALTRLWSLVDRYGQDLGRELDHDFGRHLRADGDEILLSSAERWAIRAMGSLTDAFRFPNQRVRGDAARDALWFPANQAMTAWCLWKDPSVLESELRPETIEAACAAWIAKPGAEALR